MHRRCFSVPICDIPSLQHVISSVNRLAASHRHVIPAWGPWTFQARTQLVKIQGDRQKEMLVETTNFTLREIVFLFAAFNIYPSLASTSYFVFVSIPHPSYADGQGGQDGEGENGLMSRTDGIRRRMTTIYQIKSIVINNFKTFDFFCVYYFGVGGLHTYFPKKSDSMVREEEMGEERANNSLATPFLSLLPSNNWTIWPHLPFPEDCPTRRGLFWKMYLHRREAFFGQVHDDIQYLNVPIFVVK